MAKPVERRKAERADDAEIWKDDERKTLLKLGDLFEKWNKRGGTKVPDKEKNFMETLFG
jgi:hypothetical protein